VRARRVALEQPTGGDKKIPKKVQDRLVAGLRKYQPIVRKLAERDISEADTVTVIKDMLTDILCALAAASSLRLHQIAEYSPD